MKLQTKFDIDDVVFLNTGRGVTKGTISAIAIDPSKQPKDIAFIYCIWESDRLDNAGHHVWAYEENVASTFDDAYYKACRKLPWDVSEEFRGKNLQLEITKLRTSDSCIVPEVH